MKHWILLLLRYPTRTKSPKKTKLISNFPDTLTRFFNLLLVGLIKFPIKRFSFFLFKAICIKPPPSLFLESKSWWGEHAKTCKCFRKFSTFEPIFTRKYRPDSFNRGLNDYLLFVNSNWTKKIDSFLTWISDRPKRPENPHSWNL